jgi:hypothetical protein
MENIIDFKQEKINKEQPTIDEIVSGFTSNNCDTNRPYLCQQPKRSEMLIAGLTRRDIEDCMVLGILEAKGGFPQIHVSEKGNKFKTFEELAACDEGYKDSYVDPERITYNDLYGWDLDKIDPVAAVQNMACHLERRLGIYPALLDGELTAECE